MHVRTRQRVGLSADFPAPERPSSAIVCPGMTYGASAVIQRRRGGDRIDIDSWSGDHDVVPEAIRVGCQVGLGEDYRGLSAAFPRKRKRPLDAAEARRRRQPPTISATSTSRRAPGRGQRPWPPLHGPSRTPRQHRLHDEPDRVRSAGSIYVGIVSVARTGPPPLGRLPPAGAFARTTKSPVHGYCVGHRRRRRADVWGSRRGPGLPTWVARPDHGRRE